MRPVVLRIAISPAPLTAELRRGVFLVFKEALHNIVKHSRATEAVVKFDVNGSSRQESAASDRPDCGVVEIHISENGCGFDIGSVSRFSNGLENMRQRIEALGGRFEIQSNWGKGTRISVSIPL